MEVFVRFSMKCKAARKEQTVEKEERRWRRGIVRGSRGRRATKRERDAIKVGDEEVNKEPC